MICNSFYTIPTFLILTLRNYKFVFPKASHADCNLSAQKLIIDNIFSSQEIIDQYYACWYSFESIFHAVSKQENKHLNFDFFLCLFIFV